MASILDHLPADTAALLDHQCHSFPKEQLHQPGPDFLDRCFVPGNRTPQVLRSLGQLYNHGRLAGTGYLSILPVDQGIEHTAGASFGPAGPAPRVRPAPADAAHPRGGRG